MKKLQKKEFLFEPLLELHLFSLQQPLLFSQLVVVVVLVVRVGLVGVVVVGRLLRVLLRQLRGLHLCTTIWKKGG